MFKYFGGPVFTDDNTLGILGIFLIAALPIVLALTGLGLIIRDVMQKKRRCSTLIYLGVAAVLIFIIQFVFSSAI